MNILDNLNEKIQLVDGAPCCGGEDAVEQVVATSPISLPEDYLDFLKLISGEADDDENAGVEFEVTVKDYVMPLWIFSAQFALQKYAEYKEDAAPLYDDIIDRIWPVGNDLGDLLYFYGEGKNGFGLYVAEEGALFLESVDKIADTLTDFLVKGTGIDTAFWSN